MKTSQSRDKKRWPLTGNVFIEAKITNVCDKIGTFPAWK